MFEITQKPIDCQKLKDAMEDCRAGGFVCFEGWVRNHNEGKAVSSLEYEAFEELCITEAQQILKECAERFKIFSASCVHRIGHLKLNEIAVWIGVSSAHRDNAFKACRYIIDEIKLRLPIWKKEHYVDGKAEWVNCKECYKHSHHYHSDLEEQQYYKRQTSLKQVGQKGQKKLQNARVLVVGAGGLGCPVLQALAGAGVGTISLVEHDKLDISNLHRQPLYDFHDVGQQKAFLAQEALRRYNPFVRVVTHNEKIDFTNATNLLKDIDLVLDCTDNFKAKLLVHDFCYQKRIPLICAAVYQMEGEVQVFLHGDHDSCMRCLWPVMPDKNCVQNCSESGVLGTVPAMIGQIQAKWAIDLLLGRKIEKRKLLINLESMEMDKMQLPKNASCWLCSQNEITLTAEMYEPPVHNWEVEVNEIEDLKKYKLIDIREHSERNMEDNVNLYIKKNALVDITDYKTLDCRINYLLICQRGVRSQNLTKSLHEKNLHHFYSLKNGVERLVDRKL